MLTLCVLVLQPNTFEPLSKIIKNPISPTCIHQKQFLWEAPEMRTYNGWNFGLKGFKSPQSSLYWMGWLDLIDVCRPKHYIYCGRSFGRFAGYSSLKRPWYAYERTKHVWDVAQWLTVGKSFELYVRRIHQRMRHRRRQRGRDMKLFQRGGVGLNSCEFSVV